MVEEMNFALHHFIDILSMLAGLAYGISTIGKSSKNPRGLSLFRLGSIMLLIGGGLRLLHGFPNIDWVQRHHYAVSYYGLLFENVAFGMMLVLIFLRVHKEFEPGKKASQS